MTCKNCHKNIQETDNYCPDCGAKVIRNRITMRNLLGDFSEEFLSFDNKFLKTFIDLFKKPEVVIGGYISGVRKKYVNAISYFAIALTLTGIEWFIINRFFPEVMDLSAATVEGAEERASEVLGFIQEYISIIMMLFVPAYALMSRLVFLRNKKYNYTEHLVIFMFIIAQLSIFGGLTNLIVAFFGVSIGELAYVNLPIQVIYTAYCLKRLYSLSLLGIVLRTMLFIGIFIVLYIMLIIGVLIVLFLVGGPEAIQQFAIPPPQETALLSDFFLHKLHFV